MTSKYIFYQGDALQYERPAMNTTIPSLPVDVQTTITGLF